MSVVTHMAFFRLAAPSVEGARALAASIRALVPEAEVLLPRDAHARKAWDVSVLVRHADPAVVEAAALRLARDVATAPEVLVFKAWTFGPG